MKGTFRVPEPKPEPKPEPPKIDPQEIVKKLIYRSVSISPKKSINVNPGEVAAFNVKFAPLERISEFSDEVIIT